MQTWKNFARKALVIASSVGCATLWGSPAAMAAWPEKPITFVVGYAPGGSVDAVARLVSTQLSKKLGQPIVIENLAGAGGSIGAGSAEISTCVASAAGASAAIASAMDAVSGCSAMWSWVMRRISFRGQENSSMSRLATRL